MKIKKQHSILIPLVGSGILTLGILLGYGMQSVWVSPDSQVVRGSYEGQNVEDVISLINQNFIEKRDITALEEDLIYDLVQDLDPYSQYIPPAFVDKYDQRNNGKYLGLGIETSDIGGDIIISKVLDKGPAYKAGILRGSRILKVNSNDLGLDNWNSDSLSYFLANNLDSIIHFELDHFSSEESNSISVHKEIVTLDNIGAALMLKDNVGYISILKFGNDVYRDFMKNLESIAIDSLENLIIDLRNNPGGYVDETCKIISQFLPERVEFLNSINRAGELTPYMSNGQSFFQIRNIVILINENSASASEIMAGSLQDMDRAIIIGAPSFGKGMIQEQFRLRNGAVLKLSVSRYQLPSGRTIGVNSSDDEEYTTVKKKRAVSNNGKVNPDFEIVKETSDYLVLSEAYKKLQRARSEGVFDIEDTKLEWIEELAQSYNTPLSSQIKNEMLSLLSLQDPKSRTYISGDAAVIKALDLFEDKDEWQIIK